VQVRIGRSGAARVRATSHRGYRWCKQKACENRWGPWTGWSRVSRGSHAGHIPTRTVATPTGVLHGPHSRRGRVRPAIPGVDLHERTTTSAGLRLVPTESIDTGSYVALDDGIKPPWLKDVYTDPTSDST
jgi:hypothetical protein